MLKKMTALAVAATLLVSATGAIASGLKLTDETKAQIKTTLTEQGYDVGKIKVEDGYYEAYAKKDGKKLEIYLDGDLKIVTTKVD
ncbi:PepSY domain-containing protein [Tropicimonas sp. IMCC34043]|uniref:PepSY domain-containing protein n=1 Tax=Tropicimonas sp. IMCC34043 TaxID=2248760 RepID=UPI001E3BC0EF|nr:PepSY domain-containing protein [Tropicimonas sp. IMCC34043]